MKKYSILFVLLGFVILAFAQDTMYVYLKNDELIKIATSDVDSIVFYADTITSPAVATTVTDIDGNVYNVRAIGTQIWMLENLRVTHAPDGTPITSFVYAGDESVVNTCGRLYQWDVAMNGSTEEQAQGICPDGWHVPSDFEYQILEMYYGMSESEAQLANTWRGASANVGAKIRMKEEDGFATLLSGRMNDSGSFSFLSNYEYQWTSTEYGSNAWRRCMDSSEKVGRWNTFSKMYGFSVRCVKD